MPMEEVHPDPSKRDNMPFSPAIRLTGESDLYFLSGCSPLPLYHRHPHVEEELKLPDDIQSQARMALEKARTILEAAGLGFGDVISVTEYLTDVGEANDVRSVMKEYFGEHLPSRTLVGISGLSAPASRVELTMIAAKARV